MKNSFTHTSLLLLIVTGSLIVAQASLAMEPGAASSAITSDYSETTSLMTAIVKVMGSLAVVVGLMLMLVLLLKKSGFSKGLTKGGSLINVVESRMVAPKKYIAIVEIANKCIAVGIADNTISMLTDIDRSCTQKISTPVEPDKESSSFPGLLKKAAFSIQNKTGLSKLNKGEC